MKPLGSADLVHQVEHWRSAQVDNGKGGTKKSWAKIATLNAEVIGKRGGEAVVEQALQGISTYQVRIWWRDAPAAPVQADQFREGAQVLDITSVVDPDGRRRELVILGDTKLAERLP